MLRLFRRHLKKDALPSDTYAAIRQHPIDERGRLYMEALSLPQNLRQSEVHPRILVLLIESHTVMTKKALLPSVEAYLGSHAQYLVYYYHQIFVDQKENQRIYFFKQPLI